MTPEQIEKTSQLHADLHFVDEAEKLLNMPWNKAKDRYAKNLADFAKFCVSHQWVSVGERLPENTDYVFAHVPQRILPAYCEVAYWDNEDWYTQDGELIRPDFWLPIPQLTPEKYDEKI